MSTLTIGDAGEIALPDELRERYGLVPQTPVRVVETPGGVLLVPLTDGPMSNLLARELSEWQSLSLSSWDDFEYSERP